MRLFRRARPRIRDVFTPNTAPQPQMFAPRRGEAGERLEERARDALLKPGEHLVLWGFSGVGKTSLFLHLAESLKLSRITVLAKPPTNHRSAGEALLKNALAELGFQQALTATTTSEASAHIDFGIPKAKAGIGTRETEEVVTAIQANTLDRALVKALEASHIRVLFIDGLEFVPPAERQETVDLLGALMHELSDLASNNKQMTKIVVAGVAEAADQLVPTEGPVARRVYQLQVPRMTDKELQEILRSGGYLLGLQFSDEASAAIVKACDGFPYYAHHFAYFAVERARQRLSGSDVDVVNYPDWELSLDAALQGADLRLRKPYMSTIEPSNIRQVRKKILEALAEHKHLYATLDEIRSEHLKLFPEDTDVSKAGYFQDRLTELVETFAILRVKASTIPGHGNIYSFREPLMRAYVRLHRLHPQLTELTREDLLT